MSSLPVLLAPANESVPGTLGVLGRKPEITEIESSKLRNALGKLALEISGVLQDVKQVGEFKLKEVQVGVEITAEGGVAMIGSFSAGAKGAMTLTFSL